MEHFLKQSGTVKGTEILYFADAEIDKVKDKAKSFSAIGGLSVLYFSEYHRYVLQINDWKYPLIRRLPIVASDKANLTSRTYLLPTTNGFAYILRINNIPNLQILANLEAIFSNNSNFSYQGEGSLRKIETSPDDKLYRHKEKLEAGIFEKISDTIKTGFEKVKHATESLHGTKHLTSKKKRMFLKDIKKRNFRKRAKTTFKKDFFESSEKYSREFLKLRFENPNLTQSRQFSDLTKGDLPSLYIYKEDIEEAVLHNKDLAASGKVNLVVNQPLPQSKGFIQSQEPLLGREPVLKEAPGVAQANKLAGLEGMTHYSG